jgi:hypothetical protein
MSNEKRFKGIFLYGLIAGLLVGGVASIYLYNSSIADFRQGKNIIDNLNPFGDGSQKADKPLEKPVFKDYKESKIAIDETQKEVYEEDSTDIELMGHTESFQPDVPVKRDEMMFAYNVTASGITNNDTKKLDSVLVDDKYGNNSAAVFRVEFWKSPINFTGYKLQGNKLIVFGIFDYKSLELMMVKGELYMKYLDRYYQLDRRSEFLPLIATAKP